MERGVDTLFSGAAACPEKVKNGVRPSSFSCVNTHKNTTLPKRSEMRPLCRPRGRLRTPRAAAPSYPDPDGPPPTAILPRARTQAAAKAHAAAVTSYVAAGLDDEWPVPELADDHTALAQAEGAAYAEAAAVAGADVGDVLLSVGAALTSHPSLPASFTSAFEVANKVAELVVYAGAGEGGVCCVSPADEERLSAAVGPLREEQVG